MCMSNGRCRRILSEPWTEKAPGCLAVLENLTETKPSNVNKGTIWNWKHSCLDDFILDKKK